MARRRKSSSRKRPALGKQGQAALTRRAPKTSGPPRGLDALLAPLPRLAPVLSMRKRSDLFPLDSPRQRSLLPNTRNVVRAPTVAALADKNRKQTRDPARMSKVLRDALCRDYNNERKAKRSSMFAKGSAGKSVRNRGPRKAPDWRAELCK